MFLELLLLEDWDLPALVELALPMPISQEVQTLLVLTAVVVLELDKMEAPRLAGRDLVVT